MYGTQDALAVWQRVMQQVLVTRGFQPSRLCLVCLVTPNPESAESHMSTTFFVLVSVLDWKPLGKDIRKGVKVKDPFFEWEKAKLQSIFVQETHQEQQSEARRWKQMVAWCSR